MNEHSLQAPFVYSFYVKCLKNAKSEYSEDPNIKALRKKLQNDHRQIAQPQLGNTSTLSSQSAQVISQIAKKGITSSNNSAIIQSIIRHRGSKRILELGTSLGVNAINMSLQEGVQKVVTIEGNRALVDRAIENSHALNRANVQIICSDILDALNVLKSAGEKFDLIFLDANHTYLATWQYFELSCLLSTSESILIFDDINWSCDMRKVWDKIRQVKSVGLTLENYQFGIVFPHLEFKKQHYVLDF